MKESEYQNLEIDFAMTDEFGQSNRLHKTFTTDVLFGRSHFEFLVDEFKYFLLGAGFVPESVDKIVIEFDEEEI